MNSLVLAAALLGAGANSPAPTIGSDEEALRIVEREFRLYRIQVYNSYRLMRPEYDRRRRAGEVAYEAWNKAGGQAHQAELLVQWFRTARMVSQPQMLAALPPMPAFPGAIVVAPPPAKASVPKLEAPSRGAVSIGSPARSVAHMRHRAAAAESRQAQKTAWQCVSRALFRGVVYGASRVVP
jgi:hypothetical protein